MSIDPNSPSRTEVIEEVSKWGVGAGIVVVALAPLAIPIIVLTAVALLPLLLPAIPLALIAGLLYLPVKLVRAIRARRRPLRRGGAAEEEVLVGVEFAPAHHRLAK
jgi:hypothetical protein